MFLRRINILKYWFFYDKKEVGGKEILWNIFRPVSKVLAGKYIREIKNAGDYYVVYLKNLSQPLFYPRVMNLKALYQVIVESFEPNDWHYYEAKETKAKANDIVVDCGAAEGLFGLLACQKCKKLYLVEPMPLFIESLKKTFKNITNSEILEYGLSDQPKDAYISSNGISSSINNSGNGKKIKLETLDNLFYKRQLPVTYLKVDVEGCEMELLRGGYETIKKNKPKIAITVYHRENDVLVIEKFLKSINPDYKFKYKGIEQRWGHPVMLHVW